MKGSFGARTVLTLGEAVDRVQAMHDAARSIRDDVIVLGHGGPIAQPVLSSSSGCRGGGAGRRQQHRPHERVAGAHRRWHGC
jgi:predicted TIM-barrel enzyme